MANDDAGTLPIESNSLMIIDAPTLGPAWVVGETVAYEPLSAGIDQLRYRICDGGGLCDTATVTIETRLAEPTVCVDDSASLNGGVVVIEVLANDLPGSGNFDLNTLEVIEQPFGGSVEIDTWNGQIRYNQQPNTIEDAFTYRVCDDDGSCGTALVTLRADGTTPTTPTDLIIPTWISPDGDGFNDQLVITGLENYDAHHLTVFNQWGQQVYETTAHDQRWAGSMLPSTNYILVLEVERNGVTWTYKDNLIIVR